MVDFYEELELLEDDSLSDIQTQLKRQKAVWTKRRASKPDEAKSKLDLIASAEQVFQTDDSRNKYDSELANSKKPVKDTTKEDRKAQFNKYMSDTFTYVDADKIDLARTTVEKALSYGDVAGEDRPDLLFVASQVYSFDKEWNTALKYANEMIVDFPEDFRSYGAKAEILRRQGKFSDAEAAYNEGKQAAIAVDNAAAARDFDTDIFRMKQAILLGDVDAIENGLPVEKDGSFLWSVDIYNAFKQAREKYQKIKQTVEANFQQIANPNAEEKRIQNDMLEGVNGAITEINRLISDGESNIYNWGPLIKYEIASVVVFFIGIFFLSFFGPISIVVILLGLIGMVAVFFQYRKPKYKANGDHRFNVN
jgi:tetratricopeptide (TPR) repeat protein